MRAGERAYLIARKGILEGQYPAGSRLTEHDLTRAAGVSRTPVREALRRLHAEGFVQFAPNHGAVVTAQGPEDAEEIFELRAVLEAIAAGRAALRASPETMLQLRTLARQQLFESTQRGPKHLARIGDLNDRFHRLIQQAAASRRLAQTLAGLIEAPLVSRTFGRYSIDELRRSADQHMQLVQAIEAHDAPWAESIMRAHILGGRASYLRRPGRPP
jgi:DNA-binding GntR family transcriptional regulator